MRSILLAIGLRCAFVINVLIVLTNEVCKYVWKIAPLESSYARAALTKAILSYCAKSSLSNPTT